MLAGKEYAAYLCDVCSARICQRGVVVVRRGYVALALCRPHRFVRVPGGLAV